CINKNARTDLLSTPFATAPFVLAMCVLLLNWYMKSSAIAGSDQDMWPSLVDGISYWVTVVPVI
ncbi:TPA: hypothetical protein ACN732_005525, partial [Klebsiella pneumoniae]